MFVKTFLLIFLICMCMGNARALSLDEALGNQPSSSGFENQANPSLLDDVEKDRQALKRKQAYRNYIEASKKTAELCLCLRRNDCDRGWWIGPWTFAYDDLTRQYKRGLSDIRQLCSIRVSAGGQSPLAAIEEATQAHQNVTKNISDISSSIRQANFFREYEYNKAQEEKAEQEARDKWQAEKAQMEAEVEAAWADDPVGISDDEFWQGINQTYEQTMDEIRKAEERQRKRNRQKSINRAQPVRQQPATTASLPQAVTPQEPDGRLAEKENCIRAGKKWLGTRCDYGDIEIEHPGYAFTCDSPKVTEAWEGQCDPKDGNDQASANASGSSNDIMNDLTGGGSGNSSSGSNQPANTTTAQNKTTSGSTQSDKKRPARVVPVSMQNIESAASWKTEKAACQYAIQRAFNLAEKECKTMHKGRPSTTSEIEMNKVSSCSSCRQIDIWLNDPEYKCTATVTRYCTLLD